MSSGIEPLIPAYIARQRWFGGSEVDDVRVVDRDVLRDDFPKLVWMLCDVDGDHYQLVFGGRPMGEAAEFLSGHEAAVLGDADGVFWYDAVLDPELALVLLDLITDGAEKAERVRPVGVEQSNTSLIFDDRLIGKLFRRLSRGPNLDVEVTCALAEAGFPHVAEPVATWRRDEHDLAFVQRFLAGGAEGWALALTSVRDLLATGPDDPAEAGGDFAFEAGRLGAVTAAMHLTMAEAFGTSGGDGGEWAAGMRPGLATLDPEDQPGAARVVDRLEKVVDAGQAIRVHGDYHLGQTMRTDDGWFVLDFEGEPARPLDERRRPASPLKDVTGMLRSFDYAGRTGLSERAEAEATALEALALAWSDRNRRAFLRGYLGTAGIDALLPADQESFEAVLSAFELDKAVYELGYEKAYRPTWVDIPRNAIRRLVAG